MPKLALGWQNSTLLAAVFNELSDALLLYDRDLRISGVNKAAERLLGLSSEEMVGRDCRDVFKCGSCEPGCGVMVGIELSIEGAATVKACLERRLLINCTHVTVIRLLPAMNLTEEQAHEGCDILADAIRAQAARTRS